MIIYKISYMYFICIVVFCMNNLVLFFYIVGIVNIKLMLFLENIFFVSCEFMVCINVFFKCFIEMEKMFMVFIFFFVIFLMMEF